MEERCDPKNSVNGDAFALVGGGLAAYYKCVASGGHAVIVGLGFATAQAGGASATASARRGLPLALARLPGLAVRGVNAGLAVASAGGGLESATAVGYGLAANVGRRWVWTNGDIAARAT